MRVQLKTFNGHTIVDADYLATVLNPSAMPTAKPVFIEESQADSVYSGMFTRDQRNVTLSVKIIDYPNRETLRAQLKLWFKPGTRGDLVGTFSADSLDYALPCIVLSAPASDDGITWTIILQSEATAWRAVTADTDTWSASGTSGTKTLTVAGDDETRLSMSFTPSSSGADGYAYQQLYKLVPVNGVYYGQRTWCITMDTATLVTAGKMLASCYDLRLFNDDFETQRWIDAPNTSSTKIWFNLNLQRGAQIKLRTAVASTGDITYLEFKKDTATQAKLKLMPDQGILAHGSEWIYYSGREVKQWRVKVQKRGLYNTSLQAHSIGDAFDFLPAAVRVLYGRSSATDPALDDDNYDDMKPVFNLHDSDNTQRVWTGSDLFYDPEHPDRPGSWVPGVNRLGDVSDTYLYYQNGESGNAVLGMLIGAWDKGGVAQREKSSISWTYSDPAGMRQITVTGQKYKSGGAWPASVAAIQKSNNGTLWANAFNETAPGSAASWTNLTNNSSAKTLANTTKQVRARFGLTFPATADAYAAFEIQSCTIDVVTANIPAGTLLGEQQNYLLDITLTNQTNGDAIDLTLPMRLTHTLALDAEAFTALYDLANAHKAIALDDEGRSVWIRLVPGTNTLFFSGLDIGTTAIVLTWYRRRL